MRFGHQTVIGTSGGHAVATADLDGDNDIDIVGCSLASRALMVPKLLWFENDGASPPGFTTAMVSPDFDSVEAISAADMDGDGDADVIAAILLTGDAQLVWFENDGRAPPAFTKHVVATGPPGAISIRAIDLEGDGDVDLLSLPRGSDQVKWYENDGARPPAFTNHAIGTTSDRTFGSITAADLDGDADLDVLAGWVFVSRTDPTILRAELAWFEREPGSPPSFIEHSTFTSNQDEIRSVAAADVDGDQDLDLLSAWSEGDKIAWYENDGALPPSFAEHVVTADPDGPLGHREGLANSPQQVAAGDLDADGDTDIALASFIDDTIAWFEQQGGSPPTFKYHSVSTNADGAVAVGLANLDAMGTST